MLNVTVYETVHDEDPAEFPDVHYVSLLNSGTHGPPAVIAPTKNGPPARAQVGERVLYINTSFVPMFEIERVAAN